MPADTVGKVPHTPLARPYPQRKKRPTPCPYTDIFLSLSLDNHLQGTAYLMLILYVIYPVHPIPIDIL